MSNGELIALFCMCFALVAILAIITEFDIKYLFRKKNKNYNLPYSKMPPPPKRVLTSDWEWRTLLKIYALILAEGDIDYADKIVSYFVPPVEHGFGEYVEEMQEQKCREACFKISGRWIDIRKNLRKNLPKRKS